MVSVAVWGRSPQGDDSWWQLCDWQAVGMWEQCHPMLRDRLDERVTPDWSRASVDSTSGPAK